MGKTLRSVKTNGGAHSWRLRETLRHAVYRNYFNACGADSEGEIGELRDLDLLAVGHGAELHLGTGHGHSVYAPDDRIFAVLGFCHSITFDSLQSLRVEECVQYIGPYR
jgi:hypothetical protein